MSTPRGIILRFAGLLVLLAAFSACASAGAGGPGQTVLIVENDLIDPAAATIYALAQVGGRTRVGTVSPGQTQRLDFDAYGGGSFQFVAVLTGGAELVSPPTSITPGATYRWQLRTNVVVPAD